MKFRYFVTATGRVLDTITLVNGEATYETGAAKPMFDAVLGTPIGAVIAPVKFKSWSNGYVSTTEFDVR